MSATVKTYLARNEFSSSADADVNVIELGHTCSIVRPFYFGDDWGAIRICWRMAVSGSPSTGNMTGVFFFGGVCAGYNGRFSQNGNANAHVGGLGSNTTLASVALIGHTSPYTDPANQNIGFSMTNWGFSQKSGSASGGVSSYQMFLSRYETQWSSSVGKMYPNLGNAFDTFFVCISKNSGSILNSNFTPVPNGLACVSYGGVTNALSYNPHIPRTAYDMGCEQSINTNVRNIWSFYLCDITGSLTAGGSYADTTSDTNGGFRYSIDENASGSLNSINFYWRCDSHPDSKLLIKDIRICRMEPKNIGS